VERGDTGLGRDAYGLPRRERDRRGYGPGPYPSDDGYPDAAEDDAAGPGRPVDVEEDDYGQLLRRPGEMPPRLQRLRQPGRPHPGQPGWYPPGGPSSGGPGSGMPGGGHPGQGMPGGGGAGNGAPHGGYADGGGPHRPMPRGGAPGGGPGPNSGPGPGGGPGPISGPGPGSGPGPNGGPGPNDGPGPNGGPGLNGGGQAPGRQYRLPNGRRVPPSADRLYRPPGPSVPGGTTGRHHGPPPGAQDDRRMWSRPSPEPGAPTSDGPAQGGSGGPGGGGPLREHLGRGRFEAPDGRERPGPPPEPPGPVIRQRETAVPADRPGGPGEAGQAVASIAPDDLEAFARDLRALRARADLDYPEMAEVSHYEMKTLAAAAGGLRLPTLPVAVAFVRACDGNVAEWEERWQKLAERITADAAKKRRNDGEDATEPVEPADAPAALEPPRKPAAPPPDPDGGEIYVITSAKPRQPGW